MGKPKFGGVYSTDRRGTDKGQERNGKEKNRAGIGGPKWDLNANLDASSELAVPGARTGAIIQKNGGGG